jgi:hypothetical protein
MNVTVHPRPTRDKTPVSFNCRQHVEIHAVGVAYGHVSVPDPSCIMISDPAPLKFPELSFGNKITDTA